MIIYDLGNNNELIYLIKEREFSKIGKTKQYSLKRIKDYPKCSILVLYIITNDCDKKEKIIIQNLKNILWVIIII
jgi:hypothetical protein